jgi:hypothetical protein
VNFEEFKFTEMTKSLLPPLRVKSRNNSIQTEEKEKINSKGWVISILISSGRGENEEASNCLVSCQSLKLPHSCISSRVFNSIDGMLEIYYTQMDSKTIYFSATNECSTIPDALLKRYFL